ncbi:MAG TPA: hypothetical protein VFZ40_13305 [Pyrinomonadaceae bacterium]
MEIASPLKLIFKLLILAVLATWLWVLTIGAVQSPKLTVESQPESPLHLSVFQVSPSERTGSSVITLMVMNGSATTVRAFAVAMSPGNSKTGVLLINAHNDQQMWRANEIKPITLRKTDEEILNGISFSIDYVEFEDGSKWGSDTFDSASSLAGERDGFRQAVAALTDRFRTQPVDSLSTDLDQTIDAVSTPRDHSANWNQGFHRGLNIVRARLKRAQANGGKEKLVTEWERIVAESKKTKTP